MFLALTVLCIVLLYANAQNCPPEGLRKMYTRVHDAVKPNLVWSRQIAILACEAIENPDVAEGYHTLKTEKVWANAKFPLRTIKMRNTLTEALERKDERSMVKALPENTKFGCYMKDWGLLMKMVCLYKKSD